jgi:hypothetical protein
MSDCLVYWKEHWHDPEQDVDDNWYTEQSSILKQVGIGDRLWVVISGGPSYPKEWRLFQKIEIRKVQDKKKLHKPGFRPYHVIGIPDMSPKYDIESQPDFARLLRKLEFLSGRRLKFKGRRIGLSLQKIRPVSARDAKLLERYSKKLKKRSNS